jgi:SAM-dependent methyltransferase
MKTDSSVYYDASYFAWQRVGGEYSAILDRWKFEHFIGPHDVVLDFGCGGGELLRALDCAERYGIEVNPVAREKASQLINVYAKIKDLPANVHFDVIISHHALEHVDRPFDVIEELALHLRPKGKLVFVVPSETWHQQKKYLPNNINQHVYTWTPLSFGNLFSHAGLQVQRCELLCHTWTPLTQQLYGSIPHSVYHALCRVWGLLTHTRQLRIVASAKDVD